MLFRSESFIGVKSILEMAAPFMGGGKPLPATLHPIGMGGTTNDSGIHVRMFMPTAVITTLRDMFAGPDEGGEEGAPADNGDKPPRF